MYHISEYIIKQTLWNVFFDSEDSLVDGLLCIAYSLQDVFVLCCMLM